MLGLRRRGQKNEVNKLWILECHHVKAAVLGVEEADGDGSNVCDDDDDCCSFTVIPNIARIDLL